MIRDAVNLFFGKFIRIFTETFKSDLKPPPKFDIRIITVAHG